MDLTLNIYISYPFFLVSMWFPHFFLLYFIPTFSPSAHIEGVAYLKQKILSPGKEANIIGCLSFKSCRSFFFLLFLDAISYSLFNIFMLNMYRYAY